MLFFPATVYADPWGNEKMAASYVLIFATLFVLLYSFVYILIFIYFRNKKESIVLRIYNVISTIVNLCFLVYSINYFATYPDKREGLFGSYISISIFLVIIVAIILNILSHVKSILRKDNNTF